ncbi:DNA cytosine methyltransferase [Vibrio alginolyticus]|uniref:Cytosine-specific methyltransferase n=2 Tax=Vibrio alginolyticus TaxID=663 RepID=A0A7Y4EZ65_VIBAL|nr:DNA cytosine methyltransferase [Vibrio alginolyticus]
MSFNSIDLFAGGGGLSEGLKQAGFKVVSAVENNDIAAETFRHNNKNTVVFEQDIRFVSGKEILKQCKLNKGELDLLAGCPPCQGFSSLTLQYNENDERNSLISEVARLILELEPKAVMVENVPGIIDKGHTFLDKFIKTIEKQGYIVNYDVLQVADFGVPQDRRRFVLLAGKGFEIQIPQPTHSKTGKGGLPKWKTVKEAFVGLEEPISLKNSTSYGGPRKFNWNVIRDTAPINIERLKHLKPGGPRFDIPDHLRPKCHQGKNTGFGNVYSRMAWDEASPTITGGCTTLSKGRFGHPEKLRTISVREAARLQTFPDEFEFATDLVDHACQIIGNALPCDFAKKMSEACYQAIKKAIK